MFRCYCCDICRPWFRQEGVGGWRGGQQRGPGGGDDPHAPAGAQGRPAGVPLAGETGVRGPASVHERAPRGLSHQHLSLRHHRLPLETQ